MRIDCQVECVGFPCDDVRHEKYLVPALEIDPLQVRMVMISEAAPPEPGDSYYSGPEALFSQTTLLAFADAGLPSESIADLIARGVYFTTAVKCGKMGYSIPKSAIGTCSRLLEGELALFSNAQVYLLMGDTAIAALNAIAGRAGEPRPVPAGSTYKIREGEYFFRGRRVFPSYLQAGPAFFIEKSKRAMIAEDIHSALRLVQ